MKISKYTILVIVFSLFAGIIGSQAQTRQTKEEYIARYKSIAIDHMERYGIPASITLAQGILESDSGNSSLARKSNNHFGIKCKKDWKGDRVYHTDDAPDECFRKYDSVEDSYEDHAEFLDKSPRYDKCFAYDATDYKNWAHGLKAAGYATAPDYALRLIKLIEDNDLYLFDQKNGSALYASRKRGEQGIDEDFTAHSSISTTTTHQAKIDPNAFRVSERTYRGYSVYTNNRTTFLIARNGDSFKDIATAFDITAKMLRKYNEIIPTSTADPIAGEMIYVERKQTKWWGEQSHHTVRKGETLTSLSQLYGIRLKRLAKMNRRKPYAELHDGEQIRLK
ncbi:MAG: glucosaminidase domain-containing protein [Alistipes sp.]|nr:glucosaminidase domain-containing protein [Alistipes sp.]